MKRANTRTGVFTFLLALGTAAMSFIAGAAQAAPASAVSQPDQVQMGAASGPCSVMARQMPNPAMPSQPIHVFVPAGPGKTPLTGDRCNSAHRPAVVISHGFGAITPDAYKGLIEHLVSVGNIVVFPVYPLGTNTKQFEDSYRRFDAGVVAALAATRADTSRLGFWGHSFGGGMVPYLVRQAGARGWGGRGLWMSMVAQAYSQLVGKGAIDVPRNTQAMTLAFDDDNMADARLGIDVYSSLTIPAAQKRHITVRTDTHGQQALVADHLTPASVGNGLIDAYDFLLYRYADQLQGCAIGRTSCDVDWSTVGTWSDGRPLSPARVTDHPVDVGPAPALVADCDGGLAGGPPVATIGDQTILGGINPRWEKCGPTRR
ncbi:hypothetical protein AAFP35_14870 [Gordonia sp. CPCC 206044]|uniref:alpha/beta hydrolase family protein n=1 Tax=Gordonia sp. CPCC 206044 TaxID=3140793 RepID=UPI003AF406D6